MGDSWLKTIPVAEGYFERSWPVTGPLEVRVRTGQGSIRVRRLNHGLLRLLASVWAPPERSDAEELVRDVERHPPVAERENLVVIGDEVRSWDHVVISYDLTVPQHAQVHAHSATGRVVIL
jgi:hypothetical protein